VATFDLPLEELEAYAPRLTEPADRHEFWERTLEEAEAIALDVVLEPIDTGLEAVRTWDVTFAGFGGHPVRGWLHLPSARSDQQPLPAIVQYQGYGGGRGLPHENTLWAVAGYAHMICDTRGQGSGWSAGDTADPVGSDAAHPGFMTRGILDPGSYYYRRVFVDAVRAFAVLRGHAAVDGSRVAITGASQGGGIALAVAGLVSDVAAAMIDVPFLCNFPRSLEITDADPYAEVVRYLKVHRDRREQVLNTLSYFDGVSFGRGAHAPALFSVALMDETCPPSSVYAAYNAYAGPKGISVYPYNDHEGGGAFHQAKQLKWLRERLVAEDGAHSAPNLGGAAEIGA
jgi:cephalosporin-C deacetylase